MERVLITSDRPLLGAVFGPMGPGDEAEVRAALIRSSAALVELVRVLGGAANGIGYEGLGLVWLPSGQVGIEGYVAAPGEASMAVTFLAELRPSWYDGVSGQAGWEIVTSVAVRCTHEVDHGEHVVEERSRPATTPVQAAEVLVEEVALLTTVALQRSIDQWEGLASEV